MSNLVKEIGRMTPDNLVNDIGVAIVEKSVKLKKGTQFKRGTVLGIVAETGYADIVKSTSEDGTQTADSILAEDIDASDGDVVGVAYVSGQFNRKALNFGEDTADMHELRLRELGIFMKDNM